MNPLELALLKAIDALEAEGIEYAITGAFAASAHGVVRATADLDLAVSVPAYSAELDRLEARMRRDGFTAIDPTAYRFAGRFDVELYPVTTDLDREAFARRLEVKLLQDVDREFWVLAVEDLIVVKLREYELYRADLKHVGDIKALIVANRDALDTAYLGQQVEKHGFGKLWRNMIEPGPRA